VRSVARRGRTRRASRAATRDARARSLRCHLLAGLFASALAGTPVASLAAQLGVANPGFEDIGGETPVNEFTFGPLNGWDLYDPSGVAGGGGGPTFFLGTLTPFEPDPIGSPGVYAFFPGGAPEGQRVGIAFGFSGSGGQGEWGFRQVLGDTLQPHTTYTLRVRVGNIASGTSLAGDFYPLDGFPGYRVDLLAGADLPGGGVVIAQDDDGLAGSIPEGHFAESVVQLTTGSTHPQLGQTLGIRLVNRNVVDPAHPGSDLEVDFDDVRLDASPAPSPVPALPPGAAAGLAIALAALAIARRPVAPGPHVRRTG
jgi:HpiC1 cyclase